MAQWLKKKTPPANEGEVGSISGSGRSPGEGNGNPLQYSVLGNPMDRGAWQATVHGVTKKSDTTLRLKSKPTKPSVSPDPVHDTNCLAMSHYAHCWMNPG